MKNNSAQFLIIGKPLSHSLSPAMHNAAFQFLNLPYQYEKQELEEKEVSSFIRSLTQTELIGLNVTVPYKELVFQSLDKEQIDEKALKIGAINTLHLQNGKLKAYNTDAAGYVSSLKEEKKFDLKNKNIIILGAGGSAKALSFEIAGEGAASIHLINRSQEKAAQLTENIGSYFSLPLSFDDWDFKKSQEAFSKAHLIVNTTSIGLGQNNFPLLPWAVISNTVLISDILYKPLITPFLQQALDHGRKIHQGLGMLLYQGALAFEIWTGIKAPIHIMQNTLQQALRLA